ncbi:uncharacterized protein LOC141534852 [Cotesia typhae]|uniref:uncharacterized protein LOC141534852 n=1 Tax=Cotesia typhae TaxID=2053667 RepID=UPI003D68138F
MDDDPAAIETGQEQWEDPKNKKRKRNEHRNALNEFLLDSDLEDDDNSQLNNSGQRPTKKNKIPPIVVNTAIQDIKTATQNIKSLCKDRVYFKTSNVNIIVSSTRKPPDMMIHGRKPKSWPSINLEKTSSSRKITGQ